MMALVKKPENHKAVASRYVPAPTTLEGGSRVTDRLREMVVLHEATFAA
jgi:hypothetical protein